MKTLNDYTPRQQDLLIRAAQSYLRDQGNDLGKTGLHRDGVDGDPGTKTLAALAKWGDQVFPPPLGRLGYQESWDSMRITGDIGIVNNMVLKIRAGKPQYAALSAKTGVPWYVIGILHALECNCNFNKHLHNGDPLTARTRQEPAGRPTTGSAPFSFEESALDALKYDGFTGQKDWSIVETLKRFEKYNGLGYQTKGVPSPYLWSMSNLYTAGKFVADHEYDPDAVSEQVGAAVLLQKLI